MQFNNFDKRLGERMKCRADNETQKALDVLSDRIVDALKKEPPWVDKLPEDILAVVRKSLLNEPPFWAIAIENRIAKSEETIQKNLQKKANASIVEMVQSDISDLLKLEHEANNWSSRVDQVLTKIQLAVQKCNEEDRDALIRDEIAHKLLNDIRQSLQNQAREIAVLKSWVEWRSRPWYQRWFRKWSPPIEEEEVDNGKQS